MNFRESLTEEELDDIAGVYDNEGCYGLLEGMLPPREYLDNEEDIKRVEEAIETLQEYQALILEIAF